MENALRHARQVNWDPASGVQNRVAVDINRAVDTTVPQPQRVPSRPQNKAPQQVDARSAFFLSETTAGLNIGASFLDRLTAEEAFLLHSLGRQFTVKQGKAVFRQGERHDGIFIIDEGQVHVYYTAPSGREITLAYWTPGHFIGGPEIFGGGMHIWSGEAMTDCRLTTLSGAALQDLIRQAPNFALALIDGLVAKGKCYSSMAQMLGTRSVIERLVHYLLNLAELHGRPDGSAIVIARKITHDEIAAMVGSTRQWVTMMLKRFQKKGIVSVAATGIRIERPDQLERVLLGE